MAGYTAAITVRAILVKRHDMGEADRVLVFVTDSLGAVSVVARGVRKPKSKLAGAILPLSIIELSLIQGRGELMTLRSARLIQPLGVLQENYSLSTGAQSLIELVSVLAPQKDSFSEIFDVLSTALTTLDRSTVPAESEPVITSWVLLQIARNLGFLMNLKNDEFGDPLRPELRYNLNQEAGALTPDEFGKLDADTIKMWRLMSVNELEVVMAIAGLTIHAGRSVSMLREFVHYHSR